MRAKGAKGAAKGAACPEPFAGNGGMGNGGMDMGMGEWDVLIFPSAIQYKTQDLFCHIGRPAYSTPNFFIRLRLAIHQNCLSNFSWDTPTLPFRRSAGECCIHQGAKGAKGSALSPSRFPQKSKTAPISPQNPNFLTAPLSRAHFPRPPHFPLQSLAPQ